MRIFWWGDVDDLNGHTPALYYLNDSSIPLIEYNDPGGRLKQLLFDGYTEVSRRTAYKMGLPI